MFSLFDNDPPHNGVEGEARRDKALSRLGTQYPDLIRACSYEAVRIAIARGGVCADDVRRRVTIPSGISPKFMGAVFLKLSKARILSRTGFRAWTRPEAHARPLAHWRIADLARANSWLDHHAPPDADAD